jgi:hypothetical protein
MLAGLGQGQEAEWEGGSPRRLIARSGNKTNRRPAAHGGDAQKVGRGPRRETSRSRRPEIRVRAARIEGRDECRDSGGPE